MCKYRKLECGIVIRLNADGTTDWPYGPRKGTRIDGILASNIEFCEQQTQTWRSLSELLRTDGIKYTLADLEPEVYDIAFAAVCYAILTYDRSRGASLQTYAQRMVRYAIASIKQSHVTRQLEEHHGADSSANKNNIGQIDANVDIYKYKAALSREQWLLLLARFDSYLSYDEIAREFGFASRTTAMNKIAQALAACRQLPHQ